MLISQVRRAERGIRWHGSGAQGEESKSRSPHPRRAPAGGGPTPPLRSSLPPGGGGETRPGPVTEQDQGPPREDKAASGRRRPAAPHGAQRRNMAAHLPR